MFWEMEVVNEQQSSPGGSLTEKKTEREKSFEQQGKVGSGWDAIAERRVEEKTIFRGGRSKGILYMILAGRRKPRKVNQRNKENKPLGIENMQNGRLPSRKKGKGGTTQS